MSNALPITKEQREELVAWRAEALELMPYMASILMSLRPVNSPGLGTFACDKYYRLYVDFDAVIANGWTPRFCAEALLHECAHLFSHDAQRAEEHGVTDNERSMFNIAADAANNDDLVEAGCVELGEIGVTPSDIGAPEHLLAEQYFDILRQENPGGGGDEGVGCGSASGGKPAPGELDPNDDLDGSAPAATKEETDLHDISVAADIRDREGRAPGSVPGGLRERAEVVLTPAKVSWRQVLASTIRRSAASKLGDFDATYSRRNRRCGYVPFGDGRAIRPGSETPVPRIAVVRDTSGSIGLSELRDALIEIDGIAKQMGVRQDNLIVLDVDTEAHAVRAYNGAASVTEVFGRGGTNMVMGIATAEALRPAPNSIVVVSDGGTPWPTTPGRIPVVACLVGADAEGSSRLVPSWIRTVVVSD